jgi:hypothetical protein
VAAQNKLPGTSVRGGAGARPSTGVAPDKGPHAVSELLSDRVGAPSPFGDELTFPLPVESLTYIPPTPA